MQKFKARLYDYSICIFDSSLILPLWVVSILIVSFRSMFSLTWQEFLWSSCPHSEFVQHGASYHVAKSLYFLLSIVDTKLHEGRVLCSIQEWEFTTLKINALSPTCSTVIAQKAGKTFVALISWYSLTDYTIALKFSVENKFLYFQYPELFTFSPTLGRPLETAKIFKKTPLLGLQRSFNSCSLKQYLSYSFFHTVHCLYFMTLKL